MLRWLLDQLLAWWDRLRAPSQNVQGDKALQVGQVGGNLYVIQGDAQRADQASETGRPAPGLGELMDVYKRQLTAAERAGTDKFMRREFGTTTIRNLSAGDRVRLQAYMHKCLRNRRSG